MSRSSIDDVLHKYWSILEEMGKYGRNYFPKLRQELDAAYKAELTLRGEFNPKDLEQFAPFCHGTTLEASEKISEQGLKSRISREAPSHYEEESSLPDRVYIGTGKSGLWNCLHFGALPSIMTGTPSHRGAILLFENSILQYPLAIDEDNVRNDDVTINPLTSVLAGSSFAVRGDILPADVKTVVTFDLLDSHSIVDAGKKLCNFVSKDEKNNCKSIFKNYAISDDHKLDEEIWARSRRKVL